MKTLEEIKSEVTYGSVYTIEKFIRLVDDGCIINYDGFGQYHNGENETEKSVSFDCNVLRKVKNKYPFVIWYNK